MQLFNTSLKETKKLKEDLLPKKLSSLYELKFLIENEANFMKQRLKEQRGTINVIRLLVKLKIGMPENWKGHEYKTISVDEQIEVNKLLIRVMANSLKY